MTDHKKYEKNAEAAFARLGFTPRNGQIDAVCRILCVFLDNKKKNVVLSAPTGCGKSLIGAATAEALSEISGLPNKGIKSSISLTSTNLLAHQYSATFKALENAGQYIMLKGAGNYSCDALTTPEQTANAESCALFAMQQSGGDFGSIINTYCSPCTYAQKKARKNTVRHLSTNYSYFFIDRMYTGKFENRKLLIWDEAHLVNDLFSEHNAIYFSQSRIQQMQKEIAETVTITDIEIAKTLTQLANDCAKKDKINNDNYISYLNAIFKVYEYAKTSGASLAEKALKSNNFGQYSKYTRFTKKYEGLFCKIDDLFKYNYPHVFEWKEDDNSVSVKPIFVGEMMNALQCADYNLFMSATISPALVEKTLNLTEETTGFVKLPPQFPKEHKEIIFYNPLSLSYKSLQNPEIVKQLCKNVENIVRKHISEHEERGIILTPSFKLQSDVVSHLSSVDCGKYKMFEQRRGEKLADTLTAFKAYKGGPAIMVTPSGWEGMDLMGDLSRFQIILKAPFPSLGDKRQKWILDNDPNLYNSATISKMIQGAGRSVRSDDDYCTSYVLDQQASRLWSSKLNIWQDEFTVRFTNFL